ncbi:MAG TPA: hypothetical protein VIS06_04685 [Mycobacteriales bacterium]
MPNAPKTPVQGFRLDRDLWDRFGEVTGNSGTDRTAVIRDFIRWYVGEPGVKRPTRPQP